MAIKLLIDGTITADTPEELVRYVALKEAAKAPASTPVHNTTMVPRTAQLQLNGGAPHVGVTSGVFLPRHDANLATTVTFLRAVGDRGDMGVPVEDVQTALGVDATPRAMGGKLQAVKGVLNQIGIERLDEVFQRERSPIGPIWRPGPRFGEALTKVTAQANGSR